MMTAPELLKAEMPLVRMIEANLAGYGYSKTDTDYIEHFNYELAYYRQFGWYVPKWNYPVEEKQNEAA